MRRRIKCAAPLPSPVVDRPILRTAAWMMTLAAWGVMLTWLTGRALSDRFDWSQYLSWIPTPAILLAAILFLVLASGLARASRPIRVRDHLGPRPPAARFRAAAWTAWLCLLAWMFFGEWNGTRSFTNPHEPGALRVLFWNSMEAPELAADVLSRRPDVIVLTNPPTRVDWAALQAGMGGRTYTARQERHVIVSRFPIRRWSAGSLNVTGARPRSFIFRGGGYVIQDTGHAMFLELETGLMARPLVLWVVDLPSDFNLPRRRVMKEAAHTLNTTRGPAYRRTDSGDLLEEIEGFPTPDLIVGDFNTPRGSASLAELTGTLTDAFEQAGHGFAASWPREWPLLAIDHAYIGADLKATRFEVVDFGEGRHRALVVDVQTR